MDEQILWKKVVADGSPLLGGLLWTSRISRWTEQIGLTGQGKGAHPGWFDNNFATDPAKNLPRDGFLSSHSLFSP